MRARSEEHEELERLLGAGDPIVDDVLVDLAAQAELRREDSPFYTDERLVTWLERDLESPERRNEGWTAEEVHEVAERIRANVMARLLHVAMRSGSPPCVREIIPGTIPQVQDDAVAAHAAPQLDLAAAAGAGRDLWDEQCDQWVEMPAELPAGKYIALKVAGDSMSPLFHGGDTVLVKLGPLAKPDSVVLARLADGGYVIKRVSRASPRRLELSSLNSAYPPLQVVRDEHTVVGTVVLRWCEHGRPGS